MNITDLVLPAVLTGYVRELPVPAQVRLNEYLPDREINDIEALIDRLDRTNRAAKFRAYDAETPIGKRDAFNRTKILIPPVGQKTLLGEWDQLQLQRLEGGINPDRLERAIFDDADVNARAVRIRAEMARGDVLTDGKFTLTAENGLTLEADYGIPGTHIVTASTLWSDHTGADPLVDLQGWEQIMEDDGGPTGRIVVSRNGMLHMLHSVAIRQLAASTGLVPTTLSLGQVNDLLSMFGLPQIEVYNARFDVDGVTTRAIPDNKAILLPEDPTELGYTAWGITAKAIALAASQRLSLDSAPGLVSWVEQDQDALETWTGVEAAVLPVITNPRRILIATIF